MESTVVLRSFQCSAGAFPNVRSLIERPGTTWSTLCKSHTQGFTLGGQIVSSPAKWKRTPVSCVKSPEATTPAMSDTGSSNGNPQGSLEKKNRRIATFPSGFEALVLEVCDETEIAELQLKVGDFEMHLKRNIGATVNPTHIISPTTPPPVPTKPMVESAPAAPSASPPKPSPEKTSPFSKVSVQKSPKLVALEASGSTYVLVLSPTVGSFRRGRTIKGKKQPPICKEGDVIKEGQVIGYLDQFGTELPVKSDVAGEVLKLLFDDGEAVGYGEPLIAVLPSFHGIK